MEENALIRGNIAGRTVTALLALFLFSALISSTGHAKYASFVVDAGDGKVRHSVNADTRNFPASLTKLMTLYLLFEAVDDGRLKMTSRMTVSRRAERQPASRLGLRRGSSIAVRDAIMALIIKSANDVAVVVSETLADTERKFALIMTAKARRLGMSRTTFRNASGLPHRGQLSTARDMATLARSIIRDFPHYYHLFSETRFAHGDRTYRSRNKLLKNFAGAEGMKTGYIRASGFNLVTSVKRDGHRIVGVIFGGNSPKARDRQMRRLLTRAFTKQQAENGKGTKVVAQNTSKRTKRNAIRKRVPPPAANDVWGIQVGAFFKKKPAHSAALAASKRLPKLLRNGEVVVTPLQKSRNRIVYRARILGIGKRNAYRACRLLRAKRQHCMELRLPGSIELAENQTGR